MKSRARRTIERAVAKNQPIPKAFIGSGQAFIYPSRGGGHTHHIVVWIPRERGEGEFVCSCEGWFYQEQDRCGHVLDLRAQIREGKAS